ncbi:MAG: hypothetical protein IJX14_08310, partial [Clostridia bacterium]|nr:hypothetical protein [Clostridia bacterium]
MKKSLLIFLAMLLAAGTVSCGSKPAEETTAETAAETVPETAAETELTFEAEDFGGIDFTFFGFEPHSKDWVANTYSEAFAEGENGEVINDAIFRRNMKVEELYNIRIHALGTDRSQIGPEALQMILAGDDVYQVVNVSGSTASTLLNQPDALYDLLDIATLDLTNPWWDSNSADSFTINGRL